MIESVHSGVQVIPTKTKPKKLIFIGSDGLRLVIYIYLYIINLHMVTIGDQSYTLCLKKVSLLNILH